MTNPDNVGGLIEQWRAKARTCAKIGDHQEAGVYRTCAFQLGQLCRAAPAGGDVERFSPDCEPCSDFESWVGCMRPDPNGNWVRAAPAGGVPYGGDPAEPRDDSDRYDSAPAGSGEVEPLPVFSGNWIYVDTGQRFSGADLDGAAFAVYEPLLRKLQQGAE